MREEQRQMFKVQIIKAYNNAKHAHDEIFSKRNNIHVIIGHLSIASSYIGSAKSIYICNYDKLNLTEYNEFFHQFDVFIGEAMNNIRTGHSHQWSDIEFEKLNTHYKNVESLLGIIYS